ncbi:short-chain dehydrogenase [Escherichia coli]|nr:short-chain dehydrogenase [Escherichia coli]
MGDNGIVLVIRSSNSKNTLEEFHEFFGNFKPNNSTARVEGNDSNLLIVFYVQIMPDDFVMQLHRF